MAGRNEMEKSPQLEQYQEKKPVVAVIGANGNNAEKFSSGISQVGVEVLGVDVQPVNSQLGDIHLPEDHRFDISNNADASELNAHLAQGHIDSVYISTPDKFHLPVIQEHLQHLRERKVKLIVTKPVVPPKRENLTEIRKLMRKGDISEDRASTLEGGLVEDLSPHAASIALEVYKTVNNVGTYTFSNSQEASLTRYRYNGSNLPETGFIAHGNTTISDGKKKNPFTYAWYGGKGLADKKQIKMVFDSLDVETGKPAEIVVDMLAKENKIRAPQAVQHLFTDNKNPVDNGYGQFAAQGFSDAKPHERFQSLSDAVTALK